MSFETIIATTQALAAKMDALSVLGARLRADGEGIAVDPSIRGQLDTVLAALGIEASALAALSPEQRGSVLGFIRAFFRQAGDLVEHPERPPGWSTEDPVVLQGIGRGSMSIAGVVKVLAPALGDLAARLERPTARFLDVGTGVGWLAIALANTFPAITVTGIDIWQPALVLARVNTAPLGARIEIREQNVLALPDRDAFDAAFLAGPFFPAAIVPDALRAIRVAIAPGGWVLFGLFAGPPDPVARALTDLRVVRSGGHPWTADEVVGLLGAAGFAEVRPVERTWAAPVNFVVGRRP